MKLLVINASHLLNITELAGRIESGPLISESVLLRKVFCDCHYSCLIPSPTQSQLASLPQCPRRVCYHSKLIGRETAVPGM